MTEVLIPENKEAAAGAAIQAVNTDIDEVINEASAEQLKLILEGASCLAAALRCQLKTYGVERRLDPNLKLDVTWLRKTTERMHWYCTLRNLAKTRLEELTP